MNSIRYWFFMAFSTIALVSSCSDSYREISQKRFLQMVRAKEVERITIVNDQLVEVRLTTEALAGKKYKNTFRKRRQGDKEKPHFQLIILSEKAFRDSLTVLKAPFPITIQKRGLFGSNS
ncbi:hypothetical protein GCM10028805_20240 [Spirosoma harenae]